MKPLLKRIIYTIAAIPLLVMGQCMYNEITQPRGLHTLCDAAKTGGAIKPFVDDAMKTTYQVRTGGPTGKNEDEWFDREYVRIGAWLKQTKNISDDYTVVFAKPGIGYYACIIVHPNGSVKNAWFEDRH